MTRPQLLKRRNAIKQELDDMEDAVQLLPTASFRKNETKDDRDQCVRRFEDRVATLRTEYQKTFREATV